MTPGEPIVGRDVADQLRIRPLEPVRDLDEFIAFLGWVESGSAERSDPGA